jgi:hypothetical protein
MQYLTLNEPKNMKMKPHMSSGVLPFILAVWITLENTESYQREQFIKNEEKYKELLQKHTKLSI